MDRASADTDDLDAFVDHGGIVNRRLTDVYETLARQRNHLLGAGFGRVVTDSEVTTLDNTLIFMTDLDRFVADISTALKTGIDLGEGVFTAPEVRLESQLDRTDDHRLDELQAALEAQGLSEVDAAGIRNEIEARLGRDPRFEIDGATVSEPDDLAAAIIGGIETRAAELIEANQVTSSTLHAQPRLSIDRLAADLSFAGPSGGAADSLIPPDLLLDELGAMLGDDQYAALRDELDQLDRRARLANRSLVADAPDGATLDGDLADLGTEVRDLYDGNKIGLAYGADGYRLDEPEIAYQLQLIAEHDPGRALGMKWLLDTMMTPDERAELDRVLATGGSFSERVDLATSHPGDGAIGAAKGAWNDNIGWLVDGWADAQVAITHGFYGMATNQGPRSSEVSGALPRVPTSWEENEEIIELEFTMDNLAQQGGADLAFAIEIASAAYGGGKGGVTLVRIGRKFFLRSGDDILTEVGPTLARQLDEHTTTPAGRSTTPDAPPSTPEREVVPAKKFEQVYAPGRVKHALDGNINGFGKASGGHYRRSGNLRIIEVLGTDGNDVMRARIEIWDGKVNAWKPKRMPSTFFPEDWGRRRTTVEIHEAFRNSHAVFDEAQPDALPAYWIGRSSSGIEITGRYKIPGDTTAGWSSAFPVYEGP